MFKVRKWGWYLTLLSFRQFKLKVLYFKKYGELSHQRHFKRSEVWCFLYGQGVFKLNGSSSIKSRGECGIVEVGDWHKYIAFKRTVVLELQVGDCYEDDIERDDG